MTYDMIAAGSATSVNLFGYVEPPGVSPGDTIYFGLGSLVEIDGASGTVPNPGIALGIPGAKGVASKNIYFGWSWGANAIWWSQDGGSTFAAMPGTTPFNPHRFKMSTDATLAGGGGNILYVIGFFTEFASKSKRVAICFNAAKRIWADGEYLDEPVAHDRTGHCGCVSRPDTAWPLRDRPGRRQHRFVQRLRQYDWRNLRRRAN